jgi:hypothetical protein
MGAKSKIKKQKSKKKKIKTKIPRSQRLSKLRGTALDPNKRDSRLRGF